MDSRLSRFQLISGLFSATPAVHWPRLSWFFLKSALFKIFHVSLGREQLLAFRGFNAVADVGGQSGLAFLYEIVGKHVYDVEALRQNPRAIRTVFDVGANCGFFALRYTVDFPQARFFCFEPHPRTFERLQRNIGANQLAERIVAVHAAVGASSGECQINVSEESSMSIVTSSPVQDLASSRTVKVPMTSLDAFAAARNVWPDYLKIDVEGFEAEVLRGARRCLERAAWVLLEYHSVELKRECERILKECGFNTQPCGAALLLCGKSSVREADIP